MTSQQRRAEMSDTRPSIANLLRLPVSILLAITASVMQVAMPKTDVESMKQYTLGWEEYLRFYISGI